MDIMDISGWDVYNDMFLNVFWGFLIIYSEGYCGWVYKLFFWVVGEGFGG